MVLPALLLALCLGSLAWFLRTDLGDYRAFKLLTETADRQRRYRLWALKSFLLFGCTTIAALALLGRLHALVALPADFHPLFQAMQLPAESAHSFNSGLLTGMLGALAGGLVVVLLLPRLLKRRSQFAGKPLYAGDVAPLLPRNGAETVWGAVLSVNAGISEELYFRLLLPLLLASLGCSALAAFVIAGLIFGAVHFYQGIAGIVATTILGGAMAAVYLLSGDLWIAAATHAAIDLIGLVVRPSLSRLAASRAASRA